MSPISASFDGDKAVCLRTAITRRPTDSRASLLHESQSRAPESSCHESLSYSTQMPADRHNKSGRISLTPIQSRDPRLRRTGAFSSTPPHAPATHTMGQRERHCQKTLHWGRRAVHDTLHRLACHACAMHPSITAQKRQHLISGRHHPTTSDDILATRRIGATQLHAKLNTTHPLIWPPPWWGIRL